ncbi:UNVERIFIED_CONTAM: hypothetical protein GTU68_026697 [Idotea baltica]|nr:hypothetical protein [Idotea baltica]
MGRAAHAAFDFLQDVWPQAGTFIGSEDRTIHVLCGTGNNGGDGYLLADLAWKRGLKVCVHQLGDTDRIQGDALLARKQAINNGVPNELFSDSSALGGQGVVVDAMLGTGLDRELRASYKTAIERVNSSGLAVLAIDVPSGLCADTGRVMGAAICADVTVCFIGLKRGLFTLDASDHTGAIHFTDLQLPLELYSQFESNCARLELNALLQELPLRRSGTHKGSYGAVLVVGGDVGMAGAVAMAAEAAVRSGAGLVRVATRLEHVPALTARMPEVMAHGVRTGHDLKSLVEASDVLVVGPGLGESPWSEQLFQVALECNKPMVVDADGLNLLAAKTLPKRSNWVLTPHPGEAGRLLGINTAAIQADRFAAAAQLQQRFGGIAVLKGSGTLVADKQYILLSDYGNPGMATGGMGDVLSGVLGALLGQTKTHGLTPMESVALGVCLHGAAADIASEDGQRGLAATDLIPHIRALLG